MGERDHYLHGADDVRAAANTMSSAADRMRSAADSLDATMARRQQWEEEFIMRFEAAVDRMPSAHPRPGFMLDSSGDAG